MKNRETAPIALFAYNRPSHLQRTLESLAANDLAASSDLTVYADGPRSDAHRDAVAGVRDYLRTVSGFRSITVVERAENLGLARSIIAGVTEIVNRCGRIIVLEDDMITSRHFLRYMNDALDLYECEDRVVSIHGYMFPIQGGLPETFFVKGADCWGWATWQRAWDLFEPDGRKLLAGLRQQGLLHRFDYNGTHGYARMLKDQIAGRNDSWAVRWYASALLSDRLTLYPGRSLVRNIGTDESGTHCDDTKVYETEVAVEPLMLEKIPIEESVAALQAFEEYYRSIRVPLVRRIMQRLRLS